VRPLLLIVAVLSAAPALSSAQTDLDAFMAQVLARRDENWKKLQQYTLDEHETFQITGPDARRVYGFTRDYLWFPRDGVFVRSPVKADGVSVSEDERRRAEDAWAAREQRRQQRARERKGGDTDGAGTDADIQGSDVPGVDDLVHASNEPRFVSSAYFLRFKFDPGHYALAAREKLLGRDVLRIEYYPTKLFSEGRTRPNKKIRDEDERIDEKMNKAAFVTLWVEPVEHQILQYEFHNTDLSFLPARWVVRIQDMRAAMKMAQPFPGVWLPDRLHMRFALTLATGTVGAQYDVRYHDYKLADVKTRVKGVR
jgi:hypothetical protein